MEERKFSEQELVRREKLQELVDKGIDPFGQRFDVTAYSKEIKETYGDKTHEELEEMAVEVKVAGRIMTKRRKGKVCFMHIQDRDGQIQLYVRKDAVGEDVYEIIKKGDIGDIVGVKGTVFMTNTGECSIKVEEYTHLTKALRPLPEKYHGLSDVEERYRRRYVDLIMNEEARKIAFARPKIIRSIQHYLDNQGYVEVETPVLNPILGGASARPFVTHHNALDMNFYLRIATELGLKRLIVGGMDAVYEIGRLFRNEGMDRTHNPEFTTIEVYKAFSDLEGMMDLTEGIISNAANEVCGTYELEYKGNKISLAPGFKRISMTDAIKEKLIPPELTPAQVAYTYANEADMLNVVLFGKTAKQWKDENPTLNENMRDAATLNQLLVLANLESYNAVLINQGKEQRERMELLRQLAVQQLQTLEMVSLNNLPKLGTDLQKV